MHPHACYYVIRHGFLLAEAFNAKLASMVEARVVLHVARVQRYRWRRRDVSTNNSLRKGFANSTEIHGRMAWVVGGFQASWSREISRRK
eukprot:1565997-Pyramimonas_sp.AAC.1